MDADILAKEAFDAADAAIHASSRYFDAVSVLQNLLRGGFPPCDGFLKYHVARGERVDRDDLVKATSALLDTHAALCEAAEVYKTRSQIAERANRETS